MKLDRLSLTLFVLIGLTAVPFAGSFATASETPARVKTDAPKMPVVKADETHSILPTSMPGFRDQVEAKDFAPICGPLYSTNVADLKLGTMERRLVCGDDKNDAVGKPWETIPPNEEAYFLKGFLQTRGYHHPLFIQDVERLYVRLGPVARLKSLRLLGGPEGWQPPQRRFVLGEPLTPALLNDTETWALGLIKDESYACAEDSMQADPDTGEAVVFFRLGDAKRIRKLEQSGDNGVNEGALNRYNAFVMNDRYRDRLVALTRRRTLDDGFLQTLVMTTKCGPGDEVTIGRDVSLGPPRTVRVGAGYATDQGPIFKAAVKQARIGASANNAELRLKASYSRPELNYQNLTGSFRWYYLPGETRYSLDPTLSLEHNSTDASDVRSLTAEFLHSWTFDTTEGHYALRAGPGFISEDEQRSKTPHVIEAGFVELGGRWTDHDFEWFNTSPRTGEYIDVTALMAMQHLGASFTGQKLQVQGQKLWTIGRYDPPLFVLGTRFGVSTVIGPDVNTADLPQRFLTYLGGDGDLRGYSQASLPRSTIGAQTAANASVEGRLHDVIYKVADVFAFLDVGLLGVKGNAQFDQPIFWSPGFGVRWESPVGVLRGYVARRFVTDEDPTADPYDRAFRFGVTFGEEF